MDWIISNKEWLFSGIGVSILFAIIGIFIKKKSDSSGQSIKSGDNSTNVQGGKNVNINIGGKNE